MSLSLYLFLFLRVFPPFPLPLPRPSMIYNSSCSSAGAHGQFTRYYVVLMTPATHIRTHVYLWHVWRGMKVVRARQRVPFPRINRGHGPLGGQGAKAGLLPYFQNKAILLSVERVLPRKKRSHGAGRACCEVVEISIPARNGRKFSGTTSKTKPGFSRPKRELLLNPNFLESKALPVDDRRTRRKKAFAQPS